MEENATLQRHISLTRQHKDPPPTNQQRPAVHSIRQLIDSLK